MTQYILYWRVVNNTIEVSVEYQRGWCVLDVDGNICLLLGLSWSNFNSHQSDVEIQPDNCQDCSTFFQHYSRRWWHMIIWNNYMLLANEGTFMIINVIRVHLEQVWCCFRKRWITITSWSSMWKFLRSTAHQWHQSMTWQVDLCLLIHVPVSGDRPSAIIINDSWRGYYEDAEKTLIDDDDHGVDLGTDMT